MSTGPYPDEPFNMAQTRINIDMFTDEVRVYGVKGSKTKRAKSFDKVLKMIEKGYKMFGTYDAWYSVGYHVVKGEKSKHHCTAGHFFTEEQVAALVMPRGSSKRWRDPVWDIDVGQEWLSPNTSCENDPEDDHYPTVGSGFGQIDPCDAYDNPRDLQEYYDECGGDEEGGGGPCGPRERDTPRSGISLGL